MGIQLADMKLEWWNKMFNFLQNSFRNLIGELGKRYVRGTQTKMNTLFLSIIILEYTRTLVEHVYDGNLEAALEDFHETGKITGKNIFERHVNKATLTVSKSLKDVPRLAKLFWYIAMGEDISEEKIHYVPKGTKGNEYDLVIWSFEKCIFCAAATEEKNMIINKETMGNQTWGSQCAGIFQAMMQSVQNHFENDYDVKVEETKCIMRGDPGNEFTMTFIPRVKKEQNWKKKGDM